jgi:hypothetical protein
MSSTGGSTIPPPSSWGEVLYAYEKERAPPPPPIPERVDHARILRERDRSFDPVAGLFTDAKRVFSLILAFFI